MPYFTNFVTQKFPIFIFSYFILQIIIRLFTTNIAVLDESEQIMLSQYFALGYNEQPPLYTWLQMGVFELFGTSIFGLSLLKNGLLFLTYLFVYKLGMLLMNSKLKASLSAISLMLIPQLVWGAQVDQTHTVLLTTATAISIYYFFKIAQEESSLLDFIMFGIAIGVGLNAKYNFVLVVVALIIISLVIKEFRSRFYERRLIFSIGITFLMVLPHFLWFISHLDIATNRTIARMSVGDTQNTIINFFKGNFSLVVSTIAFLTPFWIVFIALFRKKVSISSDTYSKSLLLYILVIFLFLFMVILMSGSTHVKARWLQPYLFLVPLFLFLHVKILHIDKKVNTFIYLSIFASILVALVVLVKPYLIDLRGKPSRTSYPFEQLSKKIENKIQSSKDVLLYAEDKYIGGNLKLFLPDSLIITPSLANQPYDLKNKIVLVWKNKKPIDFIEKIEKNEYKCFSYTENLPFQHSKKLIYTVNYDVCNKMN